MSSNLQNNNFKRISKAKKIVFCTIFM